MSFQRIEEKKQQDMRGDYEMKKRNLRMVDL
jgi:hypothetical protein